MGNGKEKKGGKRKKGGKQKVNGSRVLPPLQSYFDHCT